MGFWKRKPKAPPQPAPTCLRCSGVELQRLPDSSAEIEFFACPTCFRQYAREAGHNLTYRWLHPISLVLYPVLFQTDPVPLAEDMAAGFVIARPRDEVRMMLEEIELELRSPTQQVSEMLDSKASEEECRAYLAAFVQAARRHLQITNSPK